MTENALIVPEKLDVAKVFTKEGMDGLLQDIETQVNSFVNDVETPHGRSNIKSLAYQVSRSKTFIIGVGNESIAENAKKVKSMKGVLKNATTFLDDLRDKTRKPLTVWEAEQARIAEEEAKKEAEKIDKRVADLLAVEVILPRIEVGVMDDDEFQCLLDDKTFEFEERQREKAEAEAAEKKRLADEEAARKAEDERLAKQKAEQDAIAAKQKDEADKLAEQKKALESGKKTARSLAMVATGFIFDHDNEVFTFDGMEDISLEKVLSTPDNQFLGYIEGLADMVVLCKKEKAEAEEKAAEEAKIQARKDAKDKAEREAKEKAEAEEKAKAEAARQEKLRPIKDRIYDYADDILKESPPVFKELEADAIIQWATSELKELSDCIKLKADDL